MPNERDFLSGSQFRARYTLAALNVEFALSRLRLKAGFNPNQPRVAAGNPDGGRWTDTGSSGSTGTSSRSDSPGNGIPAIVRDATGKMPWSSYAERRRSDGSLISRTVTNRDGTRILSIIPLHGGERHLVTLRDGTRFEFATDGDRQRMFDGRGRLLNEAVWTPNGAQPNPIARPIHLDQHVANKVREGAATLFNWLSSLSESGAVSIAVFNASQWLRRDGRGHLEAQWIGDRAVEEIGQICAKFGLVQQFADSAAASSPPYAYPNQAVRGTAIHLKVKQEVDAIGSNDFRAELSIQKATEEARPVATKYGVRDTIRIDVFERIGEIVCVYDLKTGMRGLSALRINEIAANVFGAYPGTQQLYILKVRPR